MDFYKNINSKDVGNYLRENNYKLSAYECAWIIFQNYEIRLSEKIDALKFILTMPDCEIKCLSYPEGISLHKVINDYFDYVDRITEELTLKDDNAFYTHFTNFGQMCVFNSIYYKDYNSCIESYNEKFAGSPYASGYEIHKIFFNTYDDTIKAKYEGNELVSIHKCGNWDPIIKVFCDPLYINIPTPFKPGDILYDMAAQRAVVLGEIPSQSVGECKEHCDMDAICYYVSDDGEEIKEDTILFYTDLKYYKEELQGKDIALYAVSDFIKTSKCIKC